MNTKRIIQVVCIGTLMVCSAFAEDPQIKMEMPLNGCQDVKIHFYVDAHRRDNDANMRKGNSEAYMRAIRALKVVLSDRNNPIDAGLRQRGNGKGTEVNTGTVYLMKPKLIVPISLADPKGIGTFGPEEGVWDRETAIAQVVDNEKRNQNVIACIISNDPNLNAKHGAFKIDEERGLTIVFLHAPRESVNTGFLERFYWSVEDWTNFLRNTMGPDANDIASIIVDNYYDLGDSERKDLLSVTCEFQPRRVEIGHIRSLSRKRMWKYSITCKGKDISLEDDTAWPMPEIGNNDVCVEVKSPTGIMYRRTWTDDVGYIALEKLEGSPLKEWNELAQRARKSKAQMAVPLQEKLAELVTVLADTKTPFRRSELTGVNENVKVLTDEVRYLDAVDAHAGLLKEREVALADLEKRVSDLSDAFTAEIAALRKSYVAAFSLDEAMPREKCVAQLAACRACQSDFEGKCAGLKDKINKHFEALGISRVQGLIAAKLEEKRKECMQKVSETNRWVNEEGLKELENKGAWPQSVAGLQAYLQRVNDWQGKFEQVKVDTPKEVEEPVVVAINSPSDGVKKPSDAKKPKEEKDGNGLLYFTLAALAVACCFVIRKLWRPKLAAAVAFESEGSTDVVEKQPLYNGVLFRLSKCSEKIDLRITCRLTGNGQVEFTAESPAKPYWLVKFGGDGRLRISENKVEIEECEYNVYDDEFSLSPLGKMTLEQYK